MSGFVVRKRGAVGIPAGRGGGLVPAIVGFVAGAVVMAAVPRFTAPKPGAEPAGPVYATESPAGTRHRSRATAPAPRARPARLERRSATAGRLLGIRRITRWPWINGGLFAAYGVIVTVAGINRPTPN